MTVLPLPAGETSPVNEQEKRNLTIDAVWQEQVQFQGSGIPVMLGMGLKNVFLGRKG